MMIYKSNETFIRMPLIRIPQEAKETRRKACFRNFRFRVSSVRLTVLIYENRPR